MPVMTTSFADIQALSASRTRRVKATACRVNKDSRDMLQVLDFAHVFVPKPLHTFGRHASGGLRRDEFVDLGAEVLHQEVFFRGNLAVIDVLRPLLQRHLYAEFLVYGEDDVEEIEAVDAQIVDRVAFRRDRLDVDLAGVRDDFRDFFEGGGHVVISSDEGDSGKDFSHPGRGTRRFPAL